MKGGMDISKVKKKLSADVEIRPYQEDTAFNRNVRIQKQTDHEKENHNTVCYLCWESLRSAELTFSIIYILYFPSYQCYGNENSITIKDETYDVEEEIEETDYVEPEDRPLPILSVILKEEDANSSLYNVSIISLNCL